MLEMYTYQEIWVSIAFRDVHIKRYSELFCYIIILFCYGIILFYNIV